MNSPEPAPQRPRTTFETLIPFGFLVAWLILQTWVLPRAGFRT